VMDFSRASEWQVNLVHEELEGQGPVRVGSRVRMTRRLGRSVRPMTTEMTELDPPRSFGFSGIDGPIRATGRGTVEPVGEGDRASLWRSTSRATASARS
jgi:Polyketide cyclase / dehydrase and lipid transport